MAAVAAMVEMAGMELNSTMAVAADTAAMAEVIVLVLVREQVAAVAAAMAEMVEMGNLAVAVAADFSQTEEMEENMVDRMVDNLVAAVAAAGVIEMAEMAALEDVSSSIRK